MKRLVPMVAVLQLQLTAGACHPQRASVPPAPAARAAQAPSTPPVASPAPVPPPPATPAPPPVSCRPDRGKPLENKTGRRCVIDVGSRNVKLVVTSAATADPRSLETDRVCRSRLQLGEKTFDQKTQTARPLVATERQALAKLIGDYAEQCAHDGGTLSGAVATEWARRTTNADEIRAEVNAQTHVTLDVLSREREGHYGYLAATRGARGKTVIDFGSRSLQIAFWPRDASAPIAASVAIGIDEAGDRFFGKSEHGNYAAARAAFVTAIRAALGTNVARIRAAMKKGTLSPELYSLGENGDMAVALAGQLWDAKSHHGVDEAGYAALLKTRSPTPDAARGLVTAVLAASDLQAFARTLESDVELFQELRSDRIKRIYGYKMLAFPALVSALAEDLGVKTVVLVPQEMPDGLIVESMTTPAATAR